MTAEAAAIPGYCSEWRLDDTDGAAYDSGDTRFLDHAGYGLRNALVKTDGTPLFATAGSNSRRGLKLDNSHNWKCFVPIGWQGTIGILFYPTFANNVTLNAMTIGKQATVSSNARPFHLVRSSSVISARSNTPAVTGAQISGIPNNTVSAFIASTNQSDRNSRGTIDAVSVTTAALTASSINGNAVAPMYGGGGSPVDTSRGWLRLGNNSGTIGDLTANATDFVTVFEIVMWKGDRITSHLSELKTWLDARKAHYGT
ncbi:MAG: hypothetical protein RJA36_305 [Pseudomonadota bacterium]|jgi:hypothetical protein